MSTSTPAPGTNTNNSGGFVVLLLLALGVGGYFLFLHSRPAKLDDLVGEWKGGAKSRTVRFEKDGDILMLSPAGVVVPGTFSVESDGTVKMHLDDGSRLITKSTVRNGELTLTDPDGSSTTFKRVDPPTLTAPGRRANPDPVPAGPSIAGRWVSTESANEVLELSPQGNAVYTVRGNPFVNKGSYTYGGGVLRMALKMVQGERTVENKIEALSADEMTMFLPRLIGVREERRVKYWRIDRGGNDDTRAKLLGTWELGQPVADRIEFAADDTFRSAVQGVPSVGIFRLTGKSLERIVLARNGPLVSQLTVEAVTATVLVLTGEKPNERYEYRRAK